MNLDFQKEGYCLIPNFLCEAEVTTLYEPIKRFHQSWLKQNAEFYQERAINSAYLTAPTHLNEADRLTLFTFLASNKLMNAVNEIMGKQVAFMNTQLFFNPANKNQRNYWHRDTQYHLSLDQQKQALGNCAVLHFRLPLFDEPGIELIPQSHARWDTEQELKVRLETDGHKQYEDLPNGKQIALNAGDLLVFDANMIHRGIYGKSRLSLDILFAKPLPELFEYADPACFPGENVLDSLEDPSAFINAVDIKKAHR